jgi:2-amino-4-hydroxy-6-hydroxymethyldihydropteridine diphosphokinase
MNEVFLGLGGNTGQRLANLHKTIQEINAQIGKIIKTSSVYETQAWGSKSKNLYLNTVIKLQTELNAQDLLKKLGKIELQLGRTRNKQRNADRTIDIDILFFNDLIIEENNLQIPHPRLHLRKFVLWPLCEIEKKLIHPLLKKSIQQLRLDCTDTLEIRPYKENKPLYICFEGNIGVGKTTLAKAFAKKNNFDFLGESFEENSFLPLFYQSPAQFAFVAEWSFFVSRLEQIIKSHAKFNKTLVSDFSVYKSLWFASVNLPKKDFEQFKKQFQTMLPMLRKPDIIIHLKTKPEQLLNNINNRNRPYEKGIKSLYLAKIDKAYANGLKSIKNLPILELELKSYSLSYERKVINKIEKNIKDKFGKLTQNLYF